MYMESYLITGGEGFIGSSPRKILIKSGHGVIIIDNLYSGKLENIPKRAKFIP